MRQATMPKKVGVIIFVLTIVLLGSQLIYAQLKLHNQSSSNVALNAMMRELRTQIGELDVAVKDRDKRLKELSDVQAIRLTLESARGAIERLNKDLQTAFSERAALQTANISLNNRLENTTRELTKAITESKETRDTLSVLSQPKSQPVQAPAESKEEQASRDAALAAHKQEALRLEQERQHLLNENNVLQKRIGEAEAEKEELEKKLSGLQRDLNRQTQPLEELKQTIVKLTDALRNKEQQLRVMDAEVSQLRTRRAPGSEVDTLYESSKQQLREYAERLRETERQLEEAREERAQLQRQVTAAGDSTDGAAGTLERVSSLEAEKLALQQTVTDLEGRMLELNRQLAAAGGSSSQLKSLEDERTILIYRLKETEAALAKKTELAESLQQSLDTLRDRLVRKDEEQQAIEEKITELESMSAMLKEQLTSNKALSEDRDAQYASLRTQITQLSDVLTRKELELNERRIEMFTIKNEVAGLKVRSAQLEEDLSAARQRQRQTLDDLSQAIKLNASFQERIVEISQSQGTYKTATDFLSEGDAEKARQLKKRIEVILQPER